MNIRLDINFVAGKPVLAGLALEGFGWIIGGAFSGQLVIRSEIDLDGEIIEKGDSKLLNKFKRAIEKFDYQDNGFKSLEIDSN